MISRRETDPAAAFLHRLGEKHDVSEAEFLVDTADYLTAPLRRGLSGHLEYRKRNTIEK
jgi:transposase-like protein